MTDRNADFSPPSVINDAQAWWTDPGRTQVRVPIVEACVTQFMNQKSLVRVPITHSDGSHGSLLLQLLRCELSDKAQLCVGAVSAGRGK